MMEQDSSYRYQPLPPIAEQGRTPPFTRLLSLHPGSGEDPFEAHLQIISIEDAPPYEALSYTWGKPTDEPRDYIWIQGYPLPIKPNLEDALRSLRLPTQVRRLWIDALCIDQSDLDERSRQVQYMRLVYKHAARVIVWLGLKTAGTQEAFLAAERLARIREYTHPSPNTEQLDPNVVHELTSSMVDDLPETCMIHLDEVFERQYFNRCWCVQEVVASTWAIAKIEDLEMSFFDLIASLVILARWKGEMSIHRPYELWNLILMRRQPTTNQSRPEVEGSIGSFLGLLELTRTLQATDDRDKVFSLLGICDEGLNPVLALTQVFDNNDSWRIRLIRRGFTRVNNFKNGGLNPLFDDRTRKPREELDQEVRDLAETFLTQMAEFGLPPTADEFGHPGREEKLQAFGAGARTVLIGKRGFEHVLAWKLTRSQFVEHVYVAPGNAGTEVLPKASNSQEIAECKYPGLVQLAQELYINLAKTYLKKLDGKVLIKVDGLAAGEGVILPETPEEAEIALEEVMLRGEFGKVGKKVVIEEYLEGYEISVLTFTDETSILALPPDQDYKRAHDGNKGLNTGGMGVHTPIPSVSAALMAEIEETVIRPTIRGLELDSRPFNGMLFTGIMMKPLGPRVLKYNARFGDPETQSMILLLLGDALPELLLVCVENRLANVTLDASSEFACNITVAARGYPELYRKDDIIKTSSPPEGTERVDGELRTAGGRVFSVAATGKNLKEAVSAAYKGAGMIRFEGMFYRKDIAVSSPNLVPGKGRGYP
ncbi:HET domain containing protein [Colletotrichum incanum]|nr:HET domain containing protein [Colletotrichum incanum]